MTGTILITGGTGKTGSRIANKLASRNISFLVTSRNGQSRVNVPAGKPIKAVSFDWFDATTYINPFNEDKDIDSVYLVFAPAGDLAQAVKAFIDFAKTKGVKKFVLLSGVYSEKGDPSPHGQVHAYLDASGLDYAVLRPTWFFSKFFEVGGIKIVHFER